MTPATSLNRVLHPNNPQVKPNVPPNQIAPPANDNFANREQLVGTDVRAQADNRGATVEPGEPNHTFGIANTHTVWWTWTAPDTGRVTIDTLGSVTSTSSTALTVYVGDTLDTLLPVMRGKNYTDRFKMVLPVAGGRAYQIAWNAPYSSASNYTGQIGFNLHFTKTTLPPPVLGRDNFADRPTLKGSEAMAITDNLQATTEFNEPTHLPGTGNTHTVWWTWTAPDTGRVSLDTLGDVSSTSSTDLVVYIGDSLESLLPVMRGRDYTEGFKMVLPVESGRAYQLVLNAPYSSASNYTGQAGFNLHFTKTALPPPVLGRDNFADRPTLKGNEAMAVANNEQTTLETDEPTHTPGAENLHTVWWTWTAPATGKVTVDTLKLGVIPSALTFYQGDALADLVPVMRTRGLNEGDKLVLPVAAGQTYQIVSNGGSGQIGFNLHFTPNSLPPPVVGRDNFADRAALKGGEAMAVANNEQASIETDEPDHTPGQKDARTVLVDLDRARQRHGGNRYPQECQRHGKHLAGRLYRRRAGGPRLGDSEERGDAELCPGISGEGRGRLPDRRQRRGRRQCRPDRLQPAFPSRAPGAIRDQADAEAQAEAQTGRINGKRQPRRKMRRGCFMVLYNWPRDQEKSG